MTTEEISVVSIEEIPGRGGGRKLDIYDWKGKLASVPEDTHLALCITYASGRETHCAEVSLRAYLTCHALPFRYVRRRNKIFVMRK